MAKKKVAKGAKLGAVKSKNVFVSDPEKADRVLELDGKRFVFSPEVFRLEVSVKEAKALVEKYSYLVIEK